MNRQSNIELLRLICILYVVIHHRITHALPLSTICIVRILGMLGASMVMFAAGLLIDQIRRGITRPVLKHASRLYEVMKNRIMLND